MWALIVVGILVAVIAAFAIYDTQKKQEIQDEHVRTIKFWAAKNKFRYNPGPIEDFDYRYSELKFLQNGVGRYAFNIVEGNYANRQICTFDYHYVTIIAGAELPSEFSCVVVDASMPLRPFSIRKEDFVDRKKESVGLGDIDFDSIEFNQEFYVQAQDRRWAYDVLNQGTMEFLLAEKSFFFDRYLTIEFCERHAIAYHPVMLFDRAMFERALRIVSGILDRIPEYVRQEIGEIRDANPELTLDVVMNAFREVETHKAEEKNICSFCNTKVPLHSFKCPNCGTRL